MSGSEDTDGPHAPDPPETVVGSKADSRELHDLAEKPVEIQPSERPDSGGLASYREFARALIEIGLIEPAELAKIAVHSPKGVLGLSRALVKAGKLTTYQAAAVYQKKSRGLLIGNYVILDKVGQGGMGLVFKARHRKLGRLGALKILPPSFARDRAAVMRFRREFEAAGRLKHINLVAAFEADEDRGVHFIVMEYVEGMNLDRVVSKLGPLPVPQGVDYLAQAARGLEAAHGAGIIHRDIKPGNLMLDREGTVRVLDLGLARILDANNPFSKTATGRLTQSGMYMGTIDYMAPEQAEDPHGVDHRADIYSLGCTLFFLLTGRVPFLGKTILKRMLAHQEHAAPSLRAIRPEASPALEAVYQAMMAKRPEERPASMTDVIALLQASKVASDTELSRAARTRKRRPAADACNETPLERASSTPPIIDSAIFARRVEGDGIFIDRELMLRDLVMDALPDAGVTAEPSAVDDELEGVFMDQEFNLGDLAMELRDEAAPPAAPKPLSRRR
jgi:serine/threonine protein kinase